MDVATYVAQCAGLSIADALGGASPPVALADDGEGVFVSKWEVVGKSKPTTADIATAVAAGPSKIELLAYAASARYAKEVGGMTVGGAPIATDDRSKTLILGARDAAKDDPNYTTPFKGADGTWSTMNATQIIAVAAALLAHVAACFSQESSLASDIGSGKVTTFKAIDDAFAALTA